MTDNTVIRTGRPIYSCSRTSITIMIDNTVIRTGRPIYSCSRTSITIMIDKFWSYENCSLLPRTEEGPYVKCGM